MMFPAFVMTVSEQTLGGRVAALRSFNRFYTRQIGLLQKGLLNSPYSLTEARVIYELAQVDSTTATTLGVQLGIDPGYLSRVVRKLENAGLIARVRSAADGRSSLLSLTARGRAAFAGLDSASAEDAATLLGTLDDGRQHRLIQCMMAIEGLLAPDANRAPPFVLRPHRIGDMGWVVASHGRLYAGEYGWDETFEGLVAEIVATFIRNYDHRRDRCWIAEVDGEPVGSVFLVKKSKRVAQLRLLLVEPRAQGLGIGRRLVDECLRFARLSGYASITLWTNDVLVPARRLYESVGFKLVEEAPHESFGQKLVGQTWTKAL